MLVWRHVHLFDLCVHLFVNVLGLRRFVIVSLINGTETSMNVLFVFCRTSSHISLL